MQPVTAVGSRYCQQPSLTARWVLCCGGRMVNVAASLSRDLGFKPGQAGPPSLKWGAIEFNRGQPLLDVAESQIGLHNKLCRVWMQVKICVIPLTCFVQFGYILDKHALKSPTLTLTFDWKGLDRLGQGLSHSCCFYMP